MNKAIAKTMNISTCPVKLQRRANDKAEEEKEEVDGKNREDFLFRKKYTQYIFSGLKSWC